MNAFKVSRVLSIAFSSACLAMFVMLQAPLAKPTFDDTVAAHGISTYSALRSAGRIRVAPGRSLILESDHKIVNAAVDDPTVVQAISVEPYEVVVKSKSIGQTMMRLRNEDGTEKDVEFQVEGTAASASSATETNLAMGRSLLPVKDGRR